MSLKSTMHVRRGWTRRGFLKSHGGDTRRRSNFLRRKQRGGLDGGRDTFICGLLMHEQPGLISLQRSQEPGSERSQADGKMFLFSSLKLFIKGSLLSKVYARLRAKSEEPTLWFEKKRLWSLNDDIPRFLLYFLSLFFAITRRRWRLRRPSSLTICEILGVARSQQTRERGEKGERKWEKLRQLLADFGIWSVDYVPPRILIPLSFIERRFRNGAIGYGREDLLLFTREKRAFRRER